MAMLKGRGIGDVSLTGIYRDTRAGLWSLQRWEHDDSMEGMCPGEKAGSQTDGGSPQVQNPATLSKKTLLHGQGFLSPLTSSLLTFPTYKVLLFSSL